MKIVRHYDQKFPVEGVYPGWYCGEPALIRIKNSIIKMIDTTSITFCYKDDIDKNKVEIIIR